MRRTTAVFLSLVTMLALAASAFAMSALETLKERQRAIERAQDALTSSPDDSTRKRSLDRAVRETFDFDRLARQSIGSHWDEMTPDQQREYMWLFRSLVSKSTVHVLEQYRASKTEYGEVTGDSTDAVITTIVTSTSGDQVAIQYKLHRTNGRWWIWDRTIGLDTEITEFDVSSSENYRSAFNKLIGDEGIAGLLSKLRDKERGGSDF